MFKIQQKNVRNILKKIKQSETNAKRSRRYDTY